MKVLSINSLGLHNNALRKRTGKMVKALSLTTLMAATVQTANSQNVALEQGDRIIHIVPTELKDGTQAALYYVDSDGNPRTVEKVAINYCTESKPKNMQFVSGKNYVDKYNITQYVDTLTISQYTGSPYVEYTASTHDYIDKTLCDENGNPLAKYTDDTGCAGTKGEIKVTKDIYDKIIYNVPGMVVVDQTVIDDEQGSNKE